MQGRLTIRPYEMATATQTVQAGTFPLDSLAGGEVYVPQSCMGAWRCPLIVDVKNGSEWSPAADKYGMIVLSLPWDVVYDPRPDHNLGGYRYDSTGTGLRKVDAVLRQVLRRFAIDPDKIAVTGKCATSDASFFIGGKNPNVFSRIVVINGGLPSAYAPLEWMDTLHKTPEFVFDNGTIWTRDVQPLLRAGYRVKHISSVRAHEHTWEMYDLLGRWLRESWATPDPAARSAPIVIADPLPLLTEQALTQMTTFWTRFMQEPDSIHTTARRAHLREIVVPAGEAWERPSTIMVDMAALAAKFPSVAAALKQAGLTPQQHDANRLALFSALLFLNQGFLSGGKLLPDQAVTVANGDSVLPAVPGDATLTKNIAFLMAHPDEVDALRETGIWGTP